MAAVSLDKIAKSFGDVTVIQDVSLRVADGEFVVLLGPSGCGKSTTLRMVAGLELPSRGRILIGDKDVTRLPPGERDIAMVFQNYALYPHMSVAENMSFALSLQGIGKAEIRRRVHDAAEVLHIVPLLARKPKELSGGQRQRVAIGRAIVRAPAAFLFDEPLSNLDAQLRGHMRVELALLHKRLAGTILYVTHDQVEAMTLADRIVIFDKGCIQQVGTPDQVFEHPANLFVARFIGNPTMNILPAERHGDALRLLGSTVDLQADGLAVAPGTPVQVGVRPHDLRPAAADEPGFDMRVDVVEYLGTETVLIGRLDAAPEHPIVVALPGRMRMRGTDRLRLSTTPAAIHVFDTVTGQRLPAA